MKKVHKICKDILALTDEDINAVMDMATEQINYTHPLKLATQGRMNDLGKHNMRVVIGLKNLRFYLKDAPNSTKRSEAE